MIRYALLRECQAMQRLVGVKENSSLTTAVQVLALPILPGRHQPSIVGRDELNYRVRNGNGCTLITINTYCVLLSKNLCYYNTFAVLCQEKNW